ncbi:hypothetical protein Taro_030172 [Colocasia esculenta]|uniref:Uncharacterized protein n=1 Tax=Colocasia esculenta TaxID=4460 RepID=A0A843VVD6_COLES|nr:hypothetical protein [Colocasia esculenta]
MWPDALRIGFDSVDLHFEKFSSSNQQWWQGLARILKDKGYIKEANNKINKEILTTLASEDSNPESLTTHLGLLISQEGVEIENLARSRKIAFHERK